MRKKSNIKGNVHFRWCDWALKSLSTESRSKNNQKKSKKRQTSWKIFARRERAFKIVSSIVFGWEGGMRWVAVQSGLTSRHGGVHVCRPLLFGQRLHFLRHRRIYRWAVNQQASRLHWAVNQSNTICKSTYRLHRAVNQSNTICKSTDFHTAQSCQSK